jgi:hypothetical protein
MLPMKVFSTHTELSLPGRKGNSLGCVITFIHRLLPYIEIFQSKFKEGKYVRKEKRMFIQAVTGGSEKLNIEELHDFFCSPSIIRVMKSRRLRERET